MCRLENLPTAIALKRMMAALSAVLTSLRGIRPKAGWSSCFATASSGCRAASCSTASRGPHEPRSWGGDATEDRVHGGQQLALFHAHHDSRCFLPLPIDEATIGKPVAVILRPGKTPGGAEVALVLRHAVRAIRSHWPLRGHLRGRDPCGTGSTALRSIVDILVRGDSRYARPEALEWLERNRVGYVFGLAGGNKVLLGKIAPLAEDAAVSRVGGEAGKVRRYGDLRYAAKSWDVERQVVARAEASAQRTDSRFIVTNLNGAPRWLYEALYCARGHRLQPIPRPVGRADRAENLIKAHKLHLASDRTSCTRATANRKRSFLPTLRSACRAGEGCGLVPGLLVRA